MNQYIKGEGPYIAQQWEGRNEFVVVGPGWETVVGTYTKNESYIAARFANLAHVEGRKEAEKELEEKKAVKDTLLCGTGFMKDGKRVPPEDVYLSYAVSYVMRRKNGIYQGELSFMAWRGISGPPIKNKLRKCLGGGRNERD